MLGELLLDFLHLFGEDFDIEREGFSVRGGGFRFCVHGNPPHPQAGDPIVIEVRGGTVVSSAICQAKFSRVNHDFVVQSPISFPTCFFQSWSARLCFPRFSTLDWFDCESSPLCKFPYVRTLDVRSCLYSYARVLGSIRPLPQILPPASPGGSVHHATHSRLPLLYPLAGPPELHEQCRQKLVWHKPGAANFFRGVDHHQGHLGAHQYGRKRGEYKAFFVLTRHAHDLGRRFPVFSGHELKNEWRLFHEQSKSFYCLRVPTLFVFAKSDFGLLCQALSAR